MRILLIDDDVALCELLIEYLEGDGIKVIAVHDGHTAMKHINETWDAIILDVMLPGMNGFDLLKAIRPTSKSPVLMLTARGEDTDTVLGLELGVARAVGAIVFAVVIGAIMHFLYRKDEAVRSSASKRGFEDDDQDRSPGVVAAFFAVMIAILIFANWAEADSPAWMAVHAWKWQITTALSAVLAALLVLRWNWPVAHMAILAAVVAACAFIAPGTPELPFAIGTMGLMLLATIRPDDSEWAAQTWGFTRQIAPLLLAGVMIAGFLLGRPGHEGLIPSEWVSAAVGDNTLLSTLLASVLGAFMYFSTLTEVPIVQGLIGSGMGKGPALALLLAGPALSLPNMLVIRSILGIGKTTTYCVLVVLMATTTGYVYGNYF